ncbi:hypothetical protein [Nocardia sp. NPDC051463]|uniref:hypothetical protein n=1 Tax=Nocardia sp. NPDC051463 TaxID=3154845 RepID=UPI00344BB1CF
MRELTRIFNITRDKLEYTTSETSKLLSDDILSCSAFARNSTSTIGRFDQELRADIELQSGSARSTDHSISDSNAKEAVDRESDFPWPKHPPSTREGPEWNEYLDLYERFCRSDPSIEDDLLDLDTYLTTYDFRKWQSALRNRHTVPIPPDQQTVIDGAVRALARLPKYRGPVVRHVDNLPPEVLERYQRGNIVTEEAFTSTTTNLGGVPWLRTRPVEMRISSKTGRDMRYVVFTIRGEDEVLFPPGTRFRVTDFNEKSGRTVIEMVEEI